MQRQRAIWRSAAAVVVAAGVVALGLGSGAGGASKAEQATRTFDVVERTVGYIADNPPLGNTIGDRVIGASNLFDARGRRIGSSHWSCVRKNPGRRRHCTLTYFLSGGFVTLQGPVRDDGTGTFAITGGTGAYRTARGWVDLLSSTTPDGGRTLVFRLRFHIIR
jgi:hypothetical protein